MSRKVRGFLTVYGLVALLIVAAVSAATYFTWSESEPPTSYTVQAGDTWENLALRYSLSTRSLLRANRRSAGSPPLREGETVVVPPAPPMPVELWQAQGLGIMGEAIGVSIGFWLARKAGLMPKRLRRGVLGLSLTIAAVSYSARLVVASEVLSHVSPQAVFAAVKDGFVWSTSMALAAKAFGAGGRKR